MDVTHTAFSDKLYGRRVTLQIIVATNAGNPRDRARLIAIEDQLRELGHLVAWAS